MDGAVLVRGRGHRVRLLHVVRDDDRGDAALRERNAACAIDEMTDLRRRHRDLDELVGHVFEQGRQVDLLLIAAAEAGARLLADDRHDRLMVELGVVEPVEQMDRPGS